MSDKLIDLTKFRRIIACLPFADADAGIAETQQAMREAGAEIEFLRSQLATANERVKELEADRAKPWKHTLTTKPTYSDPTNTAYPSICEQFELTVVDTGHSERVLLLESKELDNCITQLTERAVRAERLIAECKEARKEVADGEGPTS